MKSLIKKELWPFLPPALIGALLFTVVYVLAFDVQGALLAPPSDLLPIAVLAAVCMGGLLGYGQLAVERHGGTLAFLLHRDQPVGRVVMAKCVAGWALLLAVVHLPLLLFALWERWSSPLGPVVQWQRVLELWIAALACMPAHALGMLCGTLRCAPGWRTGLLLLMLAGLGLAIAGFCLVPFAEPSAARALYAAVLLLLGVLLLLAVRSELLLVEDDERVAPAARLLSVGLLSLVLIGAPASLGVTALQHLIVLSSAKPDLIWREDVGLLRIVSSDDWVRAERIDGEPIDLVALIRPERGDRVSRLDLDLAGFATVDIGETTTCTPPALLAAHRAFPSIAPPWEEIAAVDFIEDHSSNAGGVRAFFDPSMGRVQVLHTTLGPLPKSTAEFTTTDFRRAPAPTFRALARGDGRVFSAAAFRDHDTAWPLLFEDPADGSVWSLDLGDPESTFARTEAPSPKTVTEVIEERVEPSVPVADSRMLEGMLEGRLPESVIRRHITRPVKGTVSIVDGDRLAYTLRVMDRKTGETLLEERRGPFVTGEHALPLLAAELLHPPLLILLAHRATPSGPTWDTVPQAGVLSGFGRRPLLVVAIFAFAGLLAWDVQRRLSRRGVERWRRWAWGAALLLLGLQGWLVYLALERRAPRAASVRPAARRVLVDLTREVTDPELA